ncbi:MAG: hypothetical protein ACP5FH_07890 [Terracidiphilus sp.]
MTLLNANAWEVSAGALLMATFAGAGLWKVFHRRMTADEQEQARRQFLARFGRLVDGMLLDLREVEIPARKGRREPSRTVTLLLYSYRIGGVDYESSQDISGLSGVVDLRQVRVGFPCSARYQPGNPQNSIVISEEWSGLRSGLPLVSARESRRAFDPGHLRPGRG